MYGGTFCRKTRVFHDVRRWWFVVWYFWQYVDHCGCVNPILAFTDEQLRRSNNTICGGQPAKHGSYMTSPAEPHDGFRTFLCILRLNRYLKMKGAERKPCQCHFPCNDRMYGISRVTFGPWPHKSYLKSFYDEFVGSRPFRERLEREQEVCSVTQTFSGYLCYFM